MYTKTKGKDFTEKKINYNIYIAFGSSPINPVIYGIMKSSFRPESNSFLVAKGVALSFHVFGGKCTAICDALLTVEWMFSALSSTHKPHAA